MDGASWIDLVFASCRWVIHLRHLINALCVLLVAKLGLRQTFEWFDPRLIYQVPRPFPTVKAASIVSNSTETETERKRKDGERKGEKVSRIVRLELSPLYHPPSPFVPFSPPFPFSGTCGRVCGSDKDGKHSL